MIHFLTTGSGVQNSSKVEGTVKTGTISCVQNPSLPKS